MYGVYLHVDTSYQNVQDFLIRSYTWAVKNRVLLHNVTSLAFVSKTAILLVVSTFQDKYFPISRSMVPVGSAEKMMPKRCSVQVQACDRQRSSAG